MNIELVEIIAERSLSIADQDGTTSVVNVLLGKPERIPSSTDYFTPYKIEYLGRTRLFYAAGIDGFQALQLAMKMIDAELEAIGRTHNVTILWEGDDTGNLGFV